MYIIDKNLLDELSAAARKSPRLRQHRNLHSSHKDSCQRLLNAMEPDSYIPPHCHNADPKIELFIVLRGTLLLITFFDNGQIRNVLKMVPQTATLGAELPPDVWHTVISLEPGSVFMEVKPGPFVPSAAKVMAPWAPKEETLAVQPYLEKLVRQANFILVSEKEK